MVLESVVKMKVNKQKKVIKIKKRTILFWDFLSMFFAIFLASLSTWTDKGSFSIPIALFTAIISSISHIFITLAVFFCQIIVLFILRKFRVKEKILFYVTVFIVVIFFFGLSFPFFLPEPSPQELWKDRGFPSMPMSVKFKKSYRAGSRIHIDYFLLQLEPKDVDFLVKNFKFKRLSAEKIKIRLFVDQGGYIHPKTKGWVRLKEDWEIYETHLSLGSRKDTYTMLIVRPDYKMVYIIYHYGLV